MAEGRERQTGQEPVARRRTGEFSERGGQQMVVSAQKPPRPAKTTPQASDSQPKQMKE
ncbi:hypothetical protein ABIH81_11545 [Micromonospora sp. HUAS YX12]|uniref:Uncharacterized protein n=1 Tax=Micromonospora sp. HUAS YX12 TaxID=3156396 RepID=A0AAU7R6G0_9ACTN